MLFEEKSQMKRSLRLSAAVMMVAAMTAGACAKKEPEAPPPAPVVETPPPTRPADPPPPPPPPAAPPRALTEDEIFEKMSLAELNDQAPLDPVFFALDSTDISEEARGVLTKNSDWLKRRTSTRVLVEGHADSRGTNEYNLALAERRADAVRDYLTGLGVAADRITIVSKGEEQPFCAEETESCWQQNRRARFIFTAK